MGSTIYAHTGDTGRVEWHRLTDDSGLGADVFEGENRHPSNVAIFCDTGALADLLVKLSSWPDVVAAAGERFREAIIGHVADDYVPPLSPLAVDYFRRAFDHYGFVLAEAAAEAADNGE